MLFLLTDSTSFQHQPTAQVEDEKEEKARNRNFDRKNCDHNDAATFLHNNQNGASDVNSRKMIQAGFRDEHFGLKPSTVRRRCRVCQFVWPGFFL